MIKSLTKQIAPPARPEKAPGEADWKCLEGEASLPVQYKELVKTYGSGVFGDRLNLLTPRGDIEEVTDGLREGIIANLADGESISPVLDPAAFFPEKRNGLFVFGNTFDGEYFLFCRKGRRKSFCIYLRTSDWETIVYEMTPDQLLIRLLLGSLEPPCVRNFPPANAKFVRDSDWHSSA